MYSIEDIKVIQDYIRMCSDGVALGWHERNGGNLTYRMREEEVVQCRPFFREQPGEWVSMGVQADNLKGNTLLPPAAGSISGMWSWRPRTISASWRSMRQGIPGALYGAWKTAASPPVNFPAIS